jgi:hypothetical protein
MRVKHVCKRRATMAASAPRCRCASSINISTSQTCSNSVTTGHVDRSTVLRQRVSGPLVYRIAEGLGGNVWAVCTDGLKKDDVTKPGRMKLGECSAQQPQCPCLPPTRANCNCNFDCGGNRWRTLCISAACLKHQQRRPDPGGTATGVAVTLAQRATCVLACVHALQLFDVPAVSHRGPLSERPASRPLQRPSTGRTRTPPWAGATRCWSCSRDLRASGWRARGRSRSRGSSS